MAGRSDHRTISDDLLDLSIRIKREAGVTAAQVQEVIDRFASKEQWEQRSGGIGFPLVEDIPQSNRGEFMAALAHLTPPSDRIDPRAGRMTSAADIWPSRVE